MRKKIQGRFLFNSKRSKLRGLSFYLLAFIGLIVIAYAAIFIVPVVPSRSNGENQLLFRVKIAPQSSLASISQQLKEQGLLLSSIPFQISARAIFVSSKLKPGTYLLPTGASLGKILLQISRGDRVRESIAFIPGMTIWQIRSLVDSHPALIHKTKGLSSEALLQSLNLNYPSDEGIFYPDTYIFDPDETDLSIYQRASQAMHKQLDQAWQQRATGLPLKNPYELLILSSIVEKETGKSSDRTLVAAVFINRLNKGMMLQTDPTVIYGMGAKFDGNLRKADLRRDNPYNTYMRKGLPPTPIAIPSRESLLATAHPAQSGALYFVAKGDGTSHFSETLIEHESAVDRYQRKSASKPN
jgi:UPF0755 protein